MKISVVIPVYNAEKYLEETILSIIHQTYEPYEILFVNDGSTDKSIDIIDKFRAYYEYDFNMRLINNRVNMGIGYTRQKCFDSAEGDYISFLSSDDVYHRDFIKYTVKYIKNNKYGSYTDYYRCTQELEPFEIFRSFEFNNENIVDWALNKNMFVNFSSLTLSKEINNHVRFESSLRRGEDLIYLLDILRCGFTLIRIPIPLVYYRVVESNFNLEKDLLLIRYIRHRLNLLGVDNDLSYKKLTSYLIKRYDNKHINFIKRNIKRIM